MRSATLGALLGAVAVTSLVTIPGAAAAGEHQERRFLVLSLPTLAWADLHAGHTPNLDRLVDDSAVGSLSVRAVKRVTDAADAYATISAGTRARGTAESGQVLGTEERFRGQSAREVFQSDTGTDPGAGIVSLAWPAIVARNDSLEYDAEMGALGQSLADAGVPRSVIANADGRSGPRATRYERQAGASLADRDGFVPAGAVSDELVTRAPDAPLGVAYDATAVLAAFDEVWPGGGVVLVEGSDLARADRYPPSTRVEERRLLRLDALRRTDALVGDLLTRVDLTSDAVLVVSPYHARAHAQLTVAALRASGLAPGLLRSATTRRAGLVTLVDVAPTILERFGVDRPPSMEGRPFERADVPAATASARATRMVELDEASRFRDRMVVPVARLFVGLQAVLWIGAAVVLAWGGGRRSRALVSVASLALLSVLPASYLAGLIDFHDHGTLAYWTFLAGASALAGGMAAVLGRRRPHDPLILSLALVYGLLVVDMLAGAPLQLSTVFGYSPTVGGRFAGMGNLAFGQLAAAALLLAGLLSWRLAGRRSATAVALAVLALAIVIDGMPIWGSDVGGVLALVPAVGVATSTLLDRRIRWRGIMLWGLSAAAAVAGFAAIDLSRPEAERTHLGRLVESVGNRGWGSLLTVITRKLGANLSVLTSSVWTAMVPIALGFVVFLLWQAPGHLRAVRDTIPASLRGLVVVGLLGFALNDSGIAVPGVMLGVVNASLVYLTLRVEPDADGRAPA